MPGIILAFAAIVLAWRWGEVPDRWVVHWDATGCPNGWAAKNWLDVFGPLVVAAVIWMTFEGITDHGTV